MAKKTVEGIRASLVRSGQGLGRPYPGAAREAAVEFLEDKRREGVGLHMVAAELGVSATTLRKWDQGRTSPGAARARFCEVEIVTATAGPGGVVVHVPHGVRIEGLSLEQIAELVRRLS